SNKPVAPDGEVRATVIECGRCEQRVIESKRPDGSDRKEWQRGRRSRLRSREYGADQGKGSCTTTYCGGPTRHTVIIASKFSLLFSSRFLFSCAIKRSSFSISARSTPS